MNPQTPREAEMDKLGGINPEDVTQYVDGLDWPAKKEQAAPQKTIDTLKEDAQWMSDQKSR
jgi:ABC-type taurine transport system substrate-binding protein